MNKENPEIKYYNKDFSSLREGLINFAKIYYPNSYSDFNEASPGMMFIDMAAYVGDVLSYYIDDAFKETQLLKAERTENVLQIAQSLGYKPNVTATANTALDVFMVVPKIGTGTDNKPDYRYALTINPGMEVASETYPDIIFRVDDYIDFSLSGSEYEKPEVSVYTVDGAGEPLEYLLKKQVKARSATKGTKTVEVPSSPEKYYKVLINRDDIIDIDSITDSEGNTWHEVPYLAQDFIFFDDAISNYQDYSASQYQTRYLLKLKRVNRRFISKINSDFYTEIQFGSGVSTNPDEYIIPNPANVGSSLPEGITKLDSTLDPSNFMYTKTYGEVPYDTTLTINYLYGGGIKSNVQQGDLNKLNNVEFSDVEDGLNAALVSSVKSSVAATNPMAATGGGGGQTANQIRDDALAYFAAQMRAVTKEDYLTRVYAMPGKYGTISKAYVVKDAELNRDGSGNNFALNLYVLGYDNNNHLYTLSGNTNPIKENLKTYLNQYRMLTDVINIMNAYIINIALKFTILVFSKYNKKEVLLKCIQKIRDYFNIESWQINQPIIVTEVYNELISVEGVRGVKELSFFNKWSTTDGYSGNVYNINNATKDGVIYPSITPACFEIKYPNKDIIGKGE